MRPRGQAGRGPRHSITDKGLGEGPAAQRAYVLVEPNAVCGRAEPAPPREAELVMGGLTGKGPKITPKVVFSEGHALRVRMARPDICRGTSWRTRGTGSLRGLVCPTRPPDGDGVLVKGRPV